MGKKLKEVKITVEFGNAEMLTESDLIWALNQLAIRIKTRGVENITKVMDCNGNSVGEVEVKFHPKSKKYLVWRGGQGGDYREVPESELTDAEREEHGIQP